MREYLHIDLNSRTVNRNELHGEAIARSGRYLIAKTLVECGAATVDPLSHENPLIFSAGPFAGTNFSNANRLSIGCKSPLTGGIKEANAGGTFGFALGQLGMAGLTLHGISDEWIVIHISKEGEIAYDSATPYLGLGNFAAASRLHERYGNKVSIGLCGPVGEYGGLLSGISFSDTDLRPSRLAARGGVGAVVGSKRVKAIVVELNRMPKLHDRKKVMGSVKAYNAMLNEDEIAQNMATYGTALMADVQNYLGGLPVRNFSEGRIVEDDETMAMGGQHIRELQLERGGQTAHACMPGCTIECSNVYVDKDGNELTSPVEYETLGLMGTNCGLTDPDDLARVNFIANDLGIDTIETGAMIAVLMEAGLGKFGDVGFMEEVLKEIKSGSDNGRLWAQGTGRVGAHYQLDRVPVIKQQAISAYDPRVVEADCSNMTVDEVVAASLESQLVMASSDSLGLCIFGRGVTDTNVEFVVNAINDAHGTELTEEFYTELGKETLALEYQFNRDAGFTDADDELPEFFYTEPLAPTGKVARFHAPEVNRSLGY